MKKVLVLSAGFGDGHNTAAYNICEALGNYPETKTEFVDIYIETMPWLTQFLQSGYRIAINQFPMIWGWIFNFLHRPGGLEKTLFLASSLRIALAKKIAEFQPDVIVSTYPLYAFLIQQLRQKGHKSSLVPLITMITDSTAINTSWYRAKSDFFIVVDEETASIISEDAVDPKHIQVLGFPVAPRLADLTPLSVTTPNPWKILYLPSSKPRHTLDVLHAFRNIPNIEVTVVTGRLKNLHQTLEESEIIDGKQFQLLGWTDKIPELLTTHHLYVGKAGGAIVHEAMAAQCPILISHVVPGQEEGNIELIERHDIGRLAAHYPASLAASVTEVFAHNATTWKRWKNNIKEISFPAASNNIAEFVLGCH